MGGNLTVLVGFLPGIHVRRCICTSLFYLFDLATSAASRFFSWFVLVNADKFYELQIVKIWRFSRLAEKGTWALYKVRCTRYEHQFPAV